MARALICCMLIGSIVAQDDEPGLTERISTALERARPALERDLGKTRGEPLTLVCLAALHDGMSPKGTVFAKALARLAKTNIDSTYGLALRLMVMAQCPEFPSRAELVPRDTRILLERQNGGGFSYGPHDGWWDLSNTQYAALGLRAAAHLGQEIKVGVWRSLLEDVLNGQKSDGGFSYRPSQGKTSATSSMNVAGIAVLEICRQHIELPRLTAKAVDRAIVRGWEWQKENGHIKDIGSRSVRATLYFHYGLERAAILCDRDKVGEVDWYERGAEMILAMQKKSGSFRSKTEVIGGFQGERVKGHAFETAFAILFLRRSFQKHLGATTGYCHCSSLSEQARKATVDAAIAADVNQGLKVVPELLGSMRSGSLVRRRAATSALWLISRQDFGYHPDRSNEANQKALRKAEHWWLTVGRPAAIK